MMPQNERDKYQKARESRPNPMYPKGATTGSNYAKEGDQVDPTQDPNVQALIQAMTYGLTEAIQDPNLGSPVSLTGQHREAEKDLSMLSGIGQSPSIDASILSSPGFLANVTKNAVESVTQDVKKAKPTGEGALGEVLGQDTGGEKEASDWVDEFNRRYPKENRGALLASNIGTAMSLLGALLGAPGLAAGGMALTGAGERRIKDWTRQWNNMVKAQGEDRLDKVTGRQEKADVLEQIDHAFAEAIAAGEDSPERRAEIVEEIIRANRDNKYLTPEVIQSIRTSAPTRKVDQRIIAAARAEKGVKEGEEIVDLAARASFRGHLVENREELVKLTSTERINTFANLLKEDLQKGEGAEYMGLDIEEALEEWEKLESGTMTRREEEDLPERVKAVTPSVKKEFWVKELFPGMTLADLEREITVPKGNPIVDNIGHFVGAGSKMSVGEFIDRVEAAIIKEKDVSYVKGEGYYPAVSMEYSSKKRKEAEEEAYESGLMLGESQPRSLRSIKHAAKKAPVRIFRTPFIAEPDDEDIKRRFDEAYKNRNLFTQEFLDQIRLEVLARSGR